MVCHRIGFQRPGDLDVARLTKNWKGLGVERVKVDIRQPGLAESSSDEEVIGLESQLAPAKGREFGEEAKGRRPLVTGPEQELAETEDGPDRPEGLEVESGGGREGVGGWSPDQQLEVLAGVKGGQKGIERAGHRSARMDCRLTDSVQLRWKY